MISILFKKRSEYKEKKIKIQKNVRMTNKKGKEIKKNKIKI